jgi:GAF domain-containing protein
MYHGKPVVVSEIETDPLWDKYRELARQHGLRACWSTPVKSPDGRVLGSFAMYYPQPQSPEKADFVLIERATHLAQIAIERKQAEERLQQQLKRISALHAIDLDILSSMDLASTLQSILKRVTTQLEVDAAVVWLVRPELDRLDLTAVRGFRRAEPLPQSRSLSQDLPQALLEHRLVVIPDLSQSKRPFSELSHIEGEGFVSYYGVCLTAKERPIGLLEIFRRSLLSPSSEWQDFLTTLAGQVAIAIDNAQLLEDLQRSNMSLQQAYETTIEGWSRARSARQGDRRPQPEGDRDHPAPGKGGRYDRGGAGASSSRGTFARHRQDGCAGLHPAQTGQAFGARVGPHEPAPHLRLRAAIAHRVPAARAGDPLLSPRKVGWYGVSTRA